MSRVTKIYRISVWRKAKFWNSDKWMSGDGGDVGMVAMYWAFFWQWVSIKFDFSFSKHLLHSIFFCSVGWCHESHPHSRNIATWQHSCGKCLGDSCFHYSKLQTVWKIVCNFRTVFVHSNEKIICNLWTFFPCCIAHRHESFLSLDENPPIWRPFLLFLRSM